MSARVPARVAPLWFAGIATVLVSAPVLAATPASANAAAAKTPASVPSHSVPPAVTGWTRTDGGRGGQVVRVTSLASSGPGSLRAALETSGRRVIVFEVGGIIDLARQNLAIREPHVTVAGQTAPAPGITIVRGGIGVGTHDVIVQHIRVRPGEAGAAKRSDWEVDGLSTGGAAHDVIVDHCSFTWATDENLSASGPRFRGASATEWRTGASHRITFSNNIVAEGLANSTHPKGEHSKGTLIHDNVTEVLIVGNLFAHNAERNPLFKGGARGAVINNLIYNPGPRAVHYNLIAEEWKGQAFETGAMALVGNVLRAGPSTPADVAFFSFGGSGNLELLERDNLAVDRLGRPLPASGRYTTSPARVDASDVPMPAGLVAVPAEQVQDAVVANAGARPWDRDATDRRIVADTIEGRGAIIDSEQDVGGYPADAPTQAPFDARRWNLDTLTPTPRP